MSFSVNFKTYLFCLVIFLLSGSFQNTWSQIISNETLITIDRKGRKKTERTVLIQVNDKNENWLSHVEIKHNPLQDFSFEYARILDPEGNILRKISKRNLTTRSDMSYSAFYQDDLITEFELYWHQYPYQIEYSYTIEEQEFLYVSWWTPIMYTTIPTLKASLEVIVPSDYEVHISQSGEIAFDQSNIGDTKVYQWESAYSGKIEDEIFSPPIKELIPQVGIVPINIRYGVEGSSESWLSFGSWLDALNEGTDLLPLREKMVIDKLIEGTEDKKEIIRKIYYYLQDHTRYINVAIDVGGLKSYPANYVCNNKYGDCKALTTYMKAMLKSVGIPSLYTVINAGKNEARINREFPGQQFNHVILAVPLENDTVWLENTSNSLPFNYLGTFTQDRYALAVNGGKSKLVKTPKLQPLDILEERDYSFSLNENSEWRSEATVNLRGGGFENLRYLLLNQDETGLKLHLYNKLGIKGLEIKEWKNLDFHRDSSNVKIHIVGDAFNPIRDIGNWKVINPLNISIPNFEDPGERTLDVRINYPINKADRMSYDLSFFGDSEIQIPEGIKIQSEYGEYGTEFLQEGNSIIALEKFTLLSNDISIDEYPEFHSFIQAINSHKKKTAILIR